MLKDEIADVITLHFLRAKIARDDCIATALDILALPELVQMREDAERWRKVEAYIKESHV